MARTLAVLGTSTIAAAESEGSSVDLKLASVEAVAVVTPATVNGVLRLQAKATDDAEFSDVYADGALVTLPPGGLVILPNVPARAVRVVSSLAQTEDISFVFPAVQHLS